MWFGVLAASHAQLQVYPAPAGIGLADDFTVKIRTVGGEWVAVDTYAFKVDQMTNYRHRAEVSSVASFDFEGEAEVSVTSKVPVKTCRVRPLSYNISHQVEGNTITFKLDRPRNLSVEVNGDIYHNLQLFANPPDPNKPKKAKSGRHLIYFGPGIHRLPADSLHIPSGTTVYIAGGAVVRGWLSTYRNRDIKILGRGIIMPDNNQAGLQVRYSRNVVVDGIITTQMPVGGSDSVCISNCKVLSWYGWGDGFNVFASSHVSYEHIFARTSDDCSTIYCTRKDYQGSSRHIRVKDAVYWADVAHPIMIGLHGDIEKNEVVDDVRYEDIDILEQAEAQIDYQGCIGINNGDNILVRNITFENIRIESLRQGMILNARVCFNLKYCKAPGRGIENITLRNISYNGTKPNMSIIAGYNEDRKVRNVRFENLTINGQLITDDMAIKPKWYKTADMANIFIGEHTEGITFQ